MAAPLDLSFHVVDVPRNHRHRCVHGLRTGPLENSVTGSDGVDCEEREKRDHRER